jgi:hypothetical protein
VDSTEGTNKCLVSLGFLCIALGIFGSWMFGITECPQRCIYYAVLTCHLPVTSLVASYYGLIPSARCPSSQAPSFLGPTVSDTSTANSRVSPFYPCVSNHRRELISSNVMTAYERYGSTCLSSVIFWNSRVRYWIADADSLKTVTNDRYTFQKDVEAVSNVYLAYLRCMIDMRWSTV